MPLHYAALTGNVAAISKLLQLEQIRRSEMNSRDASCSWIERLVRPLIMHNGAYQARERDGIDGFLSVVCPCIAVSKRVLLLRTCH